LRRDGRYYNFVSFTILATVLYVVLYLGQSLRVECVPAPGFRGRLELNPDVAVVGDPVNSSDLPDDRGHAVTPTPVFVLELPQDL